MFKEYYSKANWELRHNQDIYPYVVNYLKDFKNMGYIKDDRIYFTIESQTCIMCSTDIGDLLELCTNENVIQIMSALSYYALEYDDYDGYTVVKISAPIALCLLRRESEYDMRTENFYVQKNFSHERYLTGITLGKDELKHNTQSNGDGAPLVEVIDENDTQDISKYSPKQRAGWLCSFVCDRLNLLNPVDFKQYCELLSCILEGDLKDNNLNYNLKHAVSMIDSRIYSLGKSLSIKDLEFNKDSKLYLVPRLFYEYQDFILIEFDGSTSPNTPFINTIRLNGSGLIKSSVCYKYNYGSKNLANAIHLSMGLAGVYYNSLYKFLYSPGFKIFEAFVTEETAERIPELKTNEDFQKYFCPFKKIRINFERVEFINDIPVTQCNSLDDVCNLIQNEYENKINSSTSIFGGNFNAI